MELKILAISLACCLLLSCTTAIPENSLSQNSIASSVAPESLQDSGVSSMSDLSKPENVSESEDSSAISEETLPEQTQNIVVPQLAKTIVQQLGVTHSQGEKGIRTLYNYLVENVYFADPVGLDTWRYLGSDTPAIPYLENRAFSPFYFQIGSCEDFASAMVLLLEEAGFEAQYVAGFTLSIQQQYIDHAWALVKLDGNWYHLDPQLEQNIIKTGTLKYRFYLKGDASMVTDHKWGENIISSLPSVSEEEKNNIRENYLYPTCPLNWETVAPIAVTLPPLPDYSKITYQINQIKSASGKTNLPTIILNVEPPILVEKYHITPPLNDVSP